MRAARTDDNHSEVLNALRDAGALVEDTHAIPAFWDAIIGHPGTRRIGCVEIKDGKKPPSARRMTPDQIKLWDKWQGFPMALVTDIEGALRFYRMLGNNG